MKKTVFISASLLLGILCTLALKASLGLQAAVGLSALSAAILLWISRVLPDYITALGLAVCFVLLAGVPGDIVFGAFSKPSLWLLLSAFGLSLCLSKSGLLKRLAEFLLRLFPKSFMGRVLGLMAIGFVSGPFVPSMSAKAAVFAPLTLSICESSGYELKSRQSAGLFLAMMIAIRTPGPLFISASVNGYTLSGLLPQPYKDYFSMARWFISAAPWFIIVVLLSLLALWFFYRPKNEKKTEELAFSKSPEPMSRQEKQMALIISLTMLLWMTESLHGIPAYIVSVTALCIAIGCGIISSKEFCSEMNWNAVLFIGVVLQIASVFKFLGINEWLVQLFSPLFTFFAHKPYAFVLMLALSTLALRFVIVSEIALINIYMVFVIPFAMGMGINPWIACFSVYAVVCPWFCLYQSPVYLAAHYACDGKLTKASQAAAGCGIYMSISIIALLLSIKLWDGAGIFYI